MAKSRISILLSPLLCLGLLGGIVAEDSTHLQPKDVEPYHARAKAVIEEWPKEIDGGKWATEVDRELPQSAEELLHPNCVIDRAYVSRTVFTNEGPAHASLLIVQCKDSRDMAGHYPPICYPASGEPQISAEKFDLNVNGTTIPGMEYHFLGHHGVIPYRRCVYDFFIVPGRGFVRDMDGVRKAAADYQRRYYGAAQFQVVMNADYPQELRERIFKTIIGAKPGAFEVLNTVEIP